jgi:hypothetical protein
MTEAKKPKIQESELDKMQKQFDKFDENVKELTKDRMDMAPKLETEQQTRLSSREIANSKEIHLKPERSISSREKFNEGFRSQWEWSSQKVCFIAENKEIQGEAIEIWTKPFPGMPAEYWRVPVNKPVFGPRYLAEQIKNCTYHRMKMDQAVSSGADGMGQYFGAMAVDTTVQRLDAIPTSQRKSVFMGADF